MTLQGILLTKTASISSLDMGVLLGWREAFPPGVSEAFELIKNGKLPSVFEDKAWVSDAEPATKFIRELYNWIIASTRKLDNNWYNSLHKYLTIMNKKQLKKTPKLHDNQLRFLINQTWSLE